MARTNIIKKVPHIMAFWRQNPKFFIGSILIICILFLSLGAPLFTSYDPAARIGESHEPPTKEHVLGTTHLGRDVFAQTIYGGRTSIMVGILAGTIATFIAMVVGITAGYFKGHIDNIITSVINIVMVIPSIPLLLVLASMLEKITPLAIGVTIGLTSWAWGSRVIRAQTMSIRNREFIYASEVLGEHKFRILFFEVMPNMLAMISSAFVSTIVYAIMAEAALEFLGFGDPLSVTWGIMLYNAQNSAAMHIGAWWELFGPCFALVVLGVGLTLINFSVDEISNPKLKAQKIMANYYRKQKKLKNATGRAR